MPGMDGIEVCRRLKADPELRPIPVVMVSARELEDDVIDGPLAGHRDQPAFGEDGEHRDGRAHGGQQSHERPGAHEVAACIDQHGVAEGSVDEGAGVLRQDGHVVRQQAEGRQDLSGRLDGTGEQDQFHTRLRAASRCRTGPGVVALKRLQTNGCAQRIEPPTDLRHTRDDTGRVRTIELWTPDGLRLAALLYPAPRSGPRCGPAARG